MLDRRRLEQEDTSRGWPHPEPDDKMLSDTHALALPFAMSAVAPGRSSSPAALGPVTDQQLVERAAAGDERALGILYDTYSAALFSTAFRIAGERADAEEIVLETFAQAWREAGRFRTEKGSVIAWLTMMCRSRALDLVRARGRRSRLADSAAAADPGRAPAMGSPDQSPAERVAQDERARRVAEALNTLSPPQRQAVELAYYEGLSHSEIAERLQEPLGTIKTRVRLAMQKLRDALRPYYFEAAT